MVNMREFYMGFGKQDTHIRSIERFSNLVETSVLRRG